MTTPPRVSVLIASRDGERFLEAALASLAAQTLRDVEVIAVDDGSRDRTASILERFACEHPSARVLRTPGLGLAGALAAAAREARAPLLARHDDDDLSRPERLARQVEFLDRHPGIGVLGTAAVVIDERGEAQGEYPVPRDDAGTKHMLRRAPPFVHGSVVMRRELYERAGGYRAAFRASQDYDLWLRMADLATFANLGESLYAWRRHPGGVFARDRGRQVFHAAVARAFDEERRATGADAIALLERAGDAEALYAAYPRRDRLAFFLGEALVREGRVLEARAWLARAMRAPRSAAAALAWWLLSVPVAWTPRAARARAADAAAR
jgi:glycosyltransferase involved in cell wall biosynthesis